MDKADEGPLTLRTRNLWRGFQAKIERCFEFLLRWEPEFLSLSVNHEGLHLSGARTYRLLRKNKAILEMSHVDLALPSTLRDSQRNTMWKIMAVLNNCPANSISINSYSDMPCSHLSATNCNMTIRSPGPYWHVRKWLGTQTFRRSKGCPTFHNDVEEQTSLWSSNGLQGWANNKHSLIKLFEEARLPLGLLWEQRSSWFIAIQCPSFLILM